MPPGRVAAVRQGNSPEEWFSSLPGVSKVLLISLIGSTLLVHMDVVYMRSLALLWDPLWNKFEAWRLFTSAVYLGKPGMRYFMNLLIFVQYSIRYEKDAFDTGGGGGSADYLWMLVFGTTVLSILSLAFFQLAFLAIPLMFMVIYVWSRKVSWCSKCCSAPLAP
jgi:Derlin-2/3